MFAEKEEASAKCEENEISNKGRGVK